MCLHTPHEVLVAFSCDSLSNNTGTNPRQWSVLLLVDRFSQPVIDDSSFVAFERMDLSVPSSCQLRICSRTAYSVFCHAGGWFPYLDQLVDEYNKKLELMLSLQTAERRWRFGGVSNPIFSSFDERQQLLQSLKGRVRLLDRRLVRILHMLFQAARSGIIADVHKDPTGIAVLRHRSGSDQGSEKKCLQMEVVSAC